MVIATKVFAPMGSGLNDSGLSRLHHESGGRQPGRLGTDYIDLYYIHHVGVQAPLEEMLRAFDDVGPSRQNPSHGLQQSRKPGA